MTVWILLLNPNSKPIILAHNGEQVAALISIENFHLLERLIEEEEDLLDIADTEKILAETKESDWTASGSNGAHLFSRSGNPCYFLFRIFAHYLDLQFYPHIPGDVTDV